MPLNPPTGQSRTTISRTTLVTVAGAAVLFMAASVRAQEPVEGTFELNIAQRHIVETSFHRGTEIRTDAGALWLRVGAAVDAASIDVTLRGVTGTVRFHADLRPLAERLRRLTDLAPRPR